MAVAIGQSHDIPIIIRLLASLLYFCPYGSTVISDRHYIDMIVSGTSPDDPSAVADSYIRDWWNADSKPSHDQNLQFELLHQALDHHRHVTGKILQLSPTSMKEKHTWSRDLSEMPRDISHHCDNCQLYRGVAMSLADTLNDIRNRIHGIEAKYELEGNLYERRAAGFFQLYDGVLTKELNIGAMGLDKGKSKESKQEKSVRVQKLAAAELARLEALSSLKWTWGVDLSVDEAMNIGKGKSITEFRQHSGYHKSLPWGRRGDDSADPSSFSSSQIVSQIDNDELEIPELNTIDVPHHFTTYPLREELDVVPPEQLPRFDIPDKKRVPLFPTSQHRSFTAATSSREGSVIHSDSNAANDVFLDSEPDFISSSGGGVRAAMDVFSDSNSGSEAIVTADASHYNPAATFTSADSSPDLRIGKHALPPDSSSFDSHPADRVFSSSDSISENQAADVFMSSDMSSDILATNAFSDLDPDIIPTISSVTGLLAQTVISPSDPDSDNVAAGDIYASESDSEGESNARATHVFTPSESDSDGFQAAEVYHFSSDDESRVDDIGPVLGEQLVAAGLMEGDNRNISTPEATPIPSTLGPFNAQFFSRFPSAWMDPIPGEDIFDIDGDDIADADGDSIVSEE